MAVVGAPASFGKGAIGQLAGIVSNGFGCAQGKVVAFDIRIGTAVQAALAATGSGKDGTVVAACHSDGIGDAKVIDTAV